jgi:hypothetical protein
MTKFITGILICTLLFCSKVIWAEESGERLKDISKAVSNQLLRMKQEEAGAKPKVVIEGAKGKPELLEKVEQEQIPQQPVKEVELKGVNEADLSAEKTILSISKQLEKESKVLAEDKDASTVKSVEVKEASETNLQLNNMLRQQIENIVDTTPD